MKGFKLQASNFNQSALRNIIVRLSRELSSFSMTRPTKRAQLDVDNLEGLRISEQYEEHKIKDIPDAEVFYVPDFVDKDVAQEWYNELLTLDSCKFTTRNYVHKFEKCSRQKLCLGYAPKLKVYGREVTQSRKIASTLKLTSIPHVLTR